MANLEDTPAWQTILPLLSTMSIPALARKMKVPPGELAVALRRTGTARVAARAAGSPPPEPGESDLSLTPLMALPPEPMVRVIKAAPPIVGQRPSKLDRHRDLIGAMPDAAVAAKVGMSIQAVRNYRQKHGISAAGRRRTQEELEITSIAPMSVRSVSQAASARGNWAWRVEFSANPTRIVLADDAASAAERALGAGLGAVTLIERLNEAL